MAHTMYIRQPGSLSPRSKVILSLLKKKQPKPQTFRLHKLHIFLKKTYSGQSENCLGNQLSNFHYKKSPQAGHISFLVAAAHSHLHSFGNKGLKEPDSFIVELFVGFFWKVCPSTSFLSWKKRLK